jgi:hypothetical protein
MAVVVMHAVASVDGFIADANDDVGPLFDWYFNGDVDIVDVAHSRCQGRRPTTSGRCGRASQRR